MRQHIDKEFNITIVSIICYLLFRTRKTAPHCKTLPPTSFIEEWYQRKPISKNPCIKFAGTRIILFWEFHIYMHRWLNDYWRTHKSSLNLDKWWRKEVLNRYFQTKSIKRDAFVRESYVPIYKLHTIKILLWRYHITSTHSQPNFYLKSFHHHSLTGAKQQ